MLGRLPESALAILARLVAERLCKHLWHFLCAMVRQLPPGEFPHVIEGLFQPFIFKVFIEYNGMEVGWHDHISDHTQVFVCDAEIDHAPARPSKVPPYKISVIRIPFLYS